MQANPTQAVQNYVVRSNKGRSRIWLEGKRLQSAGFTAGTMFSVIKAPCGIVLQVSTTGERKVSGKPDRPIIDLCGATVEPFTTGDAVRVVYFNNSIQIIEEV